MGTAGGEFDLGRAFHGLTLRNLSENEKRTIRAQVYPRIPNFEVIEGGKSQRSTTNNDDEIR